MAQKQHCVQLSVQPSRALVDEKFKVLVQNAPPGAELTVHSHLHTEDKHNWEAFGHYICDSTGTLNCKSLSQSFSLLVNLVLNVLNGMH